jgi:hypothetical protein
MEERFGDIQPGRRPQAGPIEGAIESPPDSLQDLEEVLGRR